MCWCMSRLLTNFSLVPIEGRIAGGSAFLPGLVAFQEKRLIPLFVFVPVLHGMGHIGSLN